MERETERERERERERVHSCSFLLFPLFFFLCGFHSVGDESHPPRSLRPNWKTQTRKEIKTSTVIAISMPVQSARMHIHICMYVCMYVCMSIYLSIYTSVCALSRRFSNSHSRPRSSSSPCLLCRRPALLLDAERK